ncbi:hypothetical protein [Streptococcus sp. zg-JUN1979]|uniref:hypothetical protein n=1 Tax=Streptococcus sp. zg-JUN1979 TaxID=3391450 RepID=UPI0039A5AF70
MTVTVQYSSYSDVCYGTHIGKNFLELPQKIIDALDDYFDGAEIDMSSGYGANPDNVYVNSYYCLSNRDVLVGETKLLSREEFEQLAADDKLEDYIEKNYEMIVDRLSDSCYLLGRVRDEWHVLT